MKRSEFEKLVDEAKAIGMRMTIPQERLINCIVL